ncbi:MAG: TetR/AcrR family transcriptional regulator [Syntrophaceae bacterium]
MILYSNGHSQVSRRKARERELRREAIIEAAERVFARVGFYSATMAQIAAEAEFGMGTIYQHFPNKQGLFSEVILSSIEVFMKELREILHAQPTWQAKLKSFVEYKLAWLEKSPGYQRLIMEQLLAPIPDITPPLIERFRQAQVESIEILKEIFSLANSQRQTFDTELYPIVINGTLNEIGNDWLMGILPKTPMDYIPGILDTIAGGRHV